MAPHHFFTIVRTAALVAVALLGLAASPKVARAEDKLLEEAVDFTGTFIFLQAKTQALVIGVIRNGETVVRGYGEIADGTGMRPTATR
jgi:serine-type D-Ala-D-Ala carboxypeptidase/endopeptidase